MINKVFEGARRVLQENDLGTIITAAPNLYPHQWSWDAAFISIGLAHDSFERAVTEWNTIFGAQWETGMLPHIVFSDAPHYFPGFDVWGTAVAEARPQNIKTTGICQPPVHALCAEQVGLIGEANGVPDTDLRAFKAAAVEHLGRWHDWLENVRMQGSSKLIEIHHGWESGMDNSPRFDAAYRRIEVPTRKKLPRTDLKYADASERPSDNEYQRYIWLIDQMISAKFEDDMVSNIIDFKVGDVFMTACLAASASALARIAHSIGHKERTETELSRAARVQKTVENSIDPHTGLCRDYDERTNEWSDVQSIAGFSLLVCGGNVTATNRQREILLGHEWMNHPNNASKLPPSVSLANPAFKSREYWRGPVWPIMNWLLSHAALERGDRELATTIRDAALLQLDDLEFGEYYEPITGEPLGSHQQSWTAMAAIDWIKAPRWTQS